MKAVVIATQDSDSLLPITATRPKHLIKIAGKPIIKHCLDALKKAGIAEALIVTRPLDKAIQQYLGDGREFGLKLNHIEQPSTLGSGNAASAAEPYVDGNFVLLHGDVMFSEDALEHLMHMFENQHPNAAVAVTPMGKPENYQIVELEGAQKVKRIMKKSSTGETPSNLASAGLYVFNPDVFKTIQSVKSSIKGEIDLTDVISSMIRDNKTVYASEIQKNDWFDIRHPWDLLEVNTWTLMRMEHKVVGTVEEGAHLLGPVTVAKNARIRSGAYIEGPSFIDEGADVGPNCYIRPCTSLGKNTRIGNACEIKNSIVMDRTHVGHLSYIGDSIIGEHCNLAAGTLIANLRFDDGSVKMMVNNRVVDTGRRKLGVVLGDEVKTGLNALFMPGVKVGQNSWIGPDYIVRRDLEANTITMDNRKGTTRKKSGTVSSSKK